MFNNYMFSYLIIHVGKGQIEHTLGTKESTDHFSAEHSLRDLIGEKFPESDGWELKSFLLNEEPVKYVSELV